MVAVQKFILFLNSRIHWLGLICNRNLSASLNMIERAWFWHVMWYILVNAIKVVNYTIYIVRWSDALNFIIKISQHLKIWCRKFYPSFQKVSTLKCINLWRFTLYCHNDDIGTRILIIYCFVHIYIYTCRHTYFFGVKFMRFHFRIHLNLTGICLRLLLECRDIPILGVCLGHQVFLLMLLSCCSHSVFQRNYCFCLYFC